MKVLKKRKYIILLRRYYIILKGGLDVSQYLQFVPTCVSRYFPAICSSGQCGGTSRPCLWRDCIRNGTEQCLE